MGSDDDTSNKAVDASVGGLVWVRRRNGSWWPGRILGPEELPESCLVSPKSGTPVKLLGREDASVDWYNLEKSKRVKAFRCGEYDDCIEKAKAAANSSKKVVKYARREDAILHALELESARLGNDHPGFCSTLEKNDGEPQDPAKSPDSLHGQEETEDLGQMSSPEDDSDSELALSHSGVSFEEPDHISARKEESAERRQRRTPNDSEDDGTEGIKRMRGLEDLGMGVVSSLKRKRSQVAHVHEFLKRRNRRRPLTKVLESTMMVSVPVLCEQLGSPTGSYLAGASDSKVSGLESNESKRSLSIANNNNSDSTGVSCENGTSFNASEHACDASLVKHKQKENEISSMLGYPENGSSDSLFDVPLIAEEKHPEACAFQKPQIGVGRLSSSSSQIETVSLGNEELNESGSTSSGTADVSNLNKMIEKGASDWQLKGKRNSRHTSKSKRKDSRYMDVDEESDAYLTAMDRNVFSLVSGRKVNCSSTGGCLAFDNSYRGKSRTVSDIQLDEFGGWTSHNESHARDLTAELPQRSLPLRLSRFVLNPKYNSSDFSLRHHITNSSLYDVNVEVKASYRPHHVPYISLMSKLNGRPIIGHPLTVDVLEDGFCDDLVSCSDCYSSSYEVDDDLGEDTFALRSFGMVYERRPNSGGRMTKQALQSPSKSPKSRKNGLLSKKIRKLSSLTGHKHSDEAKKPVMEKLKGPAVACVPLKVVFSRINAALISSMRSTHRLLPPSNA
ncbi:hypothetical protein ACH5RR_024428 [Cinchona calisaya]|uniref:PWWP domain-containing protein n=1 Tax=Cinchona calisaya TaxID=153742 RepID=A0ABD2YXL9_9GENT